VLGVWDQENSDNLTTNAAGAREQNPYGTLVLPETTPRR